MADVDCCTDWRALASCRLDGELDEFQTARLARHLRHCAVCSSWTREVAALGSLLHELEPVQPALSFELRSQALRRRFVRTATFGATAALAATAAVFAIALTGTGISPLASGNASVVSAAPCVSCVKRQALRATLSPAPPAQAPVHVLNPGLDPDSAAR